VSKANPELRIASCAQAQNWFSHFSGQLAFCVSKLELRKSRIATANEALKAAHRHDGSHPQNCVAGVAASQPQPLALLGNGYLRAERIVVVIALVGLGCALAICRLLGRVAQVVVISDAAFELLALVPPLLEQLEVLRRAGLLTACGLSVRVVFAVTFILVLPIVVVIIATARAAVPRGRTVLAGGRAGGRAGARMGAYKIKWAGGARG
jgi:hypothetical protein